MYSDKHTFTGAEVLSEKERKDSFFDSFCVLKAKAEVTFSFLGREKEGALEGGAFLCSAVRRRISSFLEHTRDIGKDLT